MPFPEFSILTDSLPDSVTVGGISYPLLTDFRRWIVFTEILSDDGGDEYVRFCTAVRAVCPSGEALFGDGEAFAQLVYEISRFALLGEAPHGGGGERAFDFQSDAALIVSSFLAEYGVDITSTKMHWWRFMTLLKHLPEDCAFMRVVQLRLTDTSKIEDDDLRRRLRRAKAAVRIKDRQSEKQKD